jgi:carbon monoxide dehydrogenase subunit G
MKVGIQIERSLDIAVPYARALPLLQDFETTIRRFPKLRKLTRLNGELAYLWEMSPIGSKIAGISHEVVYAAKYQLDTERGELRWTPLPEHGNARVSGHFRLKDQGTSTALSFAVKGELDAVPVPLMYRLAAGPFIQGRFTYLVDQFLQRSAEAILGRPADAQDSA